MPALFTKISIFPCSSIIFFTNEVTLSVLDISQDAALALNFLSPTSLENKYSPPKPNLTFACFNTILS